MGSAHPKMATFIRKFLIDGRGVGLKHDVGNKTTCMALSTPSSEASCQSPRFYSHMKGIVTLSSRK